MRGEEEGKQKITNGRGRGGWNTLFGN